MASPTKVDETSESELASHPGRPREEDELDPELMRLPKRRTKIGWLLAISVIAFSVYWMVKLRHDFAYSRAGDEPARVEASSMNSESIGKFVELSLVPDRAQTSRIWAGADLGIHAAPAIGSAGRLWLVTSGSAYSEPARYDNVYAGRVRRLGDMPFFEHLRAYYSRAAPTFEPVDLSELKAARDGRAPKSLGGDPISMSAETAIEVTGQPNSRVWVVVSPEVDGPTNSLEWKNALSTQAGLDVRGEIEPETTSRVPTWIFEVSSPQGHQAIETRLAEVGLSAARLQPVRETISGTFAELEIVGGLVKLGTKSFPQSEVQTVLVANRITPDADAMVLLAGEKPADFWYMLPLFVLFAVLTGLFGWALVTSLRGSVPPTVVPNESA